MSLVVRRTRCTAMSVCAATLVAMVVCLSGASPSQALSCVGIDQLEGRTIVVATIVDVEAVQDTPSGQDDLTLRVSEIWSGPRTAETLRVRHRSLGDWGDPSPAVGDRVVAAFDADRSVDTCTLVPYSDAPWVQAARPERPQRPVVDALDWWSVLAGGLQRLLAPLVSA
jgi:hypothetical protein